MTDEWVPWRAEDFSALRVRRAKRKEILTIEAFSSEIGTRFLNRNATLAGFKPWPSGLVLESGDQTEFNGFTVLGGEAKTGKSQIAIRSAIEAAGCGWRVFYFDAENADAIVNTRIERIIGQREWTRELLEQMDMRIVGKGVSIHEIAAEVANGILDTDDRILIVIDSLNRIAKEGGGKYFDELRQLTTWCRRIVNAESQQKLPGCLAVLAVSELTRHGGMVGLDVEYAADNLLDVTRGESDGELNLNFRSRIQASKKLGRFYRQWQTCTLLHEHARPVQPPQPKSEPPNITKLKLPWGDE